MKSKRIKWLDFGKGVAILCVVLIHDKIPIPMISNLLLICAMPVFFAISGYLYKFINNFHEYKIMLYKKVTSFLIPYVVFTLLLVCRRVLQHNGNFVIHHNYLIPIAYTWFLYALFFIFIIVGIMDLLKFNLYVQLCISLFLMFGQMFLPWQMTWQGDVNPFAAIGGYMICFLLGRLINVLNLYNILKEHIIFCILGFLWIIISTWQIITTHNVNDDMFYFSNFSAKLLSIFVFFSLFICFHHNKVFNYFTKYGKYTLIIYLVHFPIVAVLKPFSLGNSFFKFFIILLLAWYVSIFVCYLAKHFKIIDFVFYPRKYINKIVLKTRWGRKLLEN